MFGKKRDSEIREATEAAKAAEIGWREEAAARLEQEADFHEMAGNLTAAGNLRSVVRYGREHVIKPIRDI